MRRRPWRRLVAWLIDWACILVWAGIVAAVGVPLYLAGVTRDVDDVTLNVIAAATIVVPVTLGLAALESSGWQATLGKR
ncbi:MAG: RDD family protein, partial [Humibacter sp.]